MPSLHPRCAQHGLAVAPDGLCVLCRRQSVGAPPAAQVASYSPPLAASQRSPSKLALKLVGALAVVALGALGASVVFELGFGGPSVVQPTAASASLAEAAPDPSAAQRALDQAKAADLAASLEMLDRAEAERLQQQRLAAAEVEQQRQQAQAAREREERERDRARHEAVARDLDAQAFNKLRGNVQITLYGTDWCGVCQRARAYMNDKRIPYKDFDIDRDEQARARAYSLNPRRSVPVITIDKELLIGWSPKSLEERINRAAHARKL